MTKKTVHSTFTFLCIDTTHTPKWPHPKNKLKNSWEAQGEDGVTD
jgi:hypothetical protein